MHLTKFLNAILKSLKNSVYKSTKIISTNLMILGYYEDILKILELINLFKDIADFSRLKN